MKSVFNNTLAAIVLSTATLTAAAAAPTPTTAPEFTGIQQWLNSEPLAMGQLRGKVVLVDFWTYTCINCIRTLPYVKSWHEKYKDQGLVVVIHYECLLRCLLYTSDAADE